MKTLHARLRSVLLLLALPTVVLVVLQAFFERREVLIGIGEQAERTAGALALEQKQFMDEARQFLMRLARSPQVRDAQQCSAFLAEVVDLNPTYDNLAVARADGELLCNAPAPPRAVNVQDRPYFRQARDQRRFSVSMMREEMQGERAAGLPDMTFAYPIQSDGADGPVVGVVVAAASPKRWAPQRDLLTAPKAVISYVVEEAQRVVALAPRRGEVLGQAPPPPEGGRGQNGAERNGVVAGPDGQRRLFRHERVFEDDAGAVLYVGVGLPIDAALAVANWRAFLGLALLFGFGGGLLWLVRHVTQRAILQPLQDLKQEVANDAVWAPHASCSANVEEFGFLSAEFAKAKGGRLAAEKAEHMRQEQLEAVLDALPDLYFRLDRNYLVLDYKAREHDDLLFPPEEFLGRNMEDLLPSEAAQKFRENIERHQQSQDMVSWDYSLDINGETRHFEARACPVHGGRETILIVRNITNRRNAEEAMRLAAMVYESSSEGMIVTDAAHHILTTNPALTRLVGQDDKALIGRNLRSLLPAPMRRKLRNGFARARAGGKGWGGEVQILCRAGRSIPVWLTINAIFDKTHSPYRYVILVRDMTAQKKANETIWKQAHIDVLTGLLNRAALGEYLEDVIRDASAGRKEIALLFMDLDGLKQVNDRLGHAAGDQVLKRVSDRLRNCLDQGVTIARYGGDEFIVVLDQGHIAEQAQIVETLLEEIAIPFGIEKDVVHLTGSLGIARYPTDAVTAEDLISAADQAMYVAKSGGRNRAVPFSSGMRRAAVEKMNLVSALQKAVHNRQMDVHFQPIIDLKTGKICKAEALLRWHSDSLGQVPPAQFIPLAEEAGLIDRLGDLVFEQCCEALPSLRRCFGHAFQISINVSPLQLISSIKGFQSWLQRLEESGQRGDGFIIEITENALLETQGPLVGKLDTLQRAGFQLALDDFGKGYSSLFYFLKYKIDYLKIDQAFVRDLSGNNTAETLCRSMVEMAHRLNVQVVAEGIETENQCAFLAQIGADFGQGYLFEHPVPLKDLLNSREGERVTRVAKAKAKAFWT
ncbi:bifunctional diguanylate cyclase/phosphodiesterase [Aliiroseovarius crassostreae]|uniref:bifunctional diguanylate cyclase/phosphodiesterase n=1 Tax=Aliiroseovarius crassostreae TaxID=154981 RepID=UPI002205B96F|nr:EAL domain-containing protein [Aliiroseovarius crassostreae]UWP88752.1 EAL domain-containing protein [Aliiroseovarius crassostreae]